MRVLVLNSDYTCHDIWTWQKTMAKLLGEKSISVVEKSDKNIKDGRGNIYNVPSVVVINKFIPGNHRYASLSKINIYCRDSFTCQYCETKLKKSELSIDHVLPKEFWKKFDIPIKQNSFENLVTCCKPCNKLKGNKSPEQAGMKLIKEPRKITIYESLKNKIVYLGVQKEWVNYLL
jgi:5-methylcytosine-specific restriction endonuclease McrA